MIVNVFNKKLTDVDKKYLSNISSLSRCVNIDLAKQNSDVKVHLSDIIKDEREILIDANDATAIIFWGFPKDLYKQKVYHSLMERNNVYFTAFNDGDVVEYDQIKETLPRLYARLVKNYITDNNGNYLSVSDIVIKEVDKGNSLIAGIKEITTNHHMIWKMAHSIFQQETLKTTLGSYWHIVRDMVFFVTYVIFMIFMRGFNDIEGIPIVMYLVSGLVAWYYISDIIGGGAACIKQSRGIISKVKFPVTIIPVYHSLAIFYRRGLTYIILAVVAFSFILFSDSTVTFRPLLFIYYTVSMLVFMTGFNLLFSSFVALSRDFHELYKSFIRIQMYFHPIFWDVSSVQNKLESSGNSVIVALAVVFKVLMLSPTVYILTGYRQSFGAIRENGLLETAVFWFFVVVVYTVGFKIQAKVRKLYADII